MKIKIYQINHDRDVNRVSFERFDNLEKYQQGHKGVDASIYDMVYVADVSCETLEDVFLMFNFDLPDDFRGHSLSVSDVVEIDESTGEQGKGFYYVDSFGFKAVSFEVEKAQVMYKPANLIDVMVCEPGKTAEIKPIVYDYNTLTALVKGGLEQYFLLEEINATIICNRDHRVNGSEFNRAIYKEYTGNKEEREVVEFFSGTIIIAGIEPDNDSLVSLSAAQIEKLTEMFGSPEFRISLDGKLAVVDHPFPDAGLDYRNLEDRIKISEAVSQYLSSNKSVKEQKSKDDKDFDR